ncbi:hypothetical protein LTR94_011905 [Friedmanniomyces endolithicus]|nr:hypothetical protein LTR94_011905 [Friedmanniomyces endolithicus]
MEPFEKLFRYWPECKVVICKHCRYAIIPSNIRNHIKTQHTSVTRRQRQEIVERVTCMDVAQVHTDVQRPDADSEPVSELPMFRDGLRCQNTIGDQLCEYVCRDVSGMQQHQRHIHQWVNPQKRGGDRRSEDRARRSYTLPWLDGQLCQPLFRTEQKARHDRSRTIEEFGERTVASPWIEHVRWPQHLAGFSRQELASLIRADPEEAGEDPEPATARSDSDSDEDDRSQQKEAELAEACKATRRLIRRAFHTATPDQVGGRAPLEYVNRRECGAESQEKPFHSEQMVKTIHKSSGHWVKILRYLWRSAQLDRCPGYQLIAAQECRFGVMRQAAEKVLEPARNAAQRKRRRQRLVEATLEFWIDMFDHHLKDSEFENGVISGLAVLGMDTQTSGWIEAQNYTPVLAAMITVLRAIVLYRAWQARQQAVRRYIKAGRSEREARAEAPSVYEGVRGMVDQFMTLTQFHGHPTPLDRIYHQKTYGMKIRSTTKAEGRVSWIGDRMLINNISFSMDDIRTVVHGLNHTIRQRLVQDLLWMTPCESAETWKPPRMPTFELATLFDNHAEMSEGWNFIQDRRHSWDVEGSEWMWQRVFDHDRIRESLVASSMEEIQAGNTRCREVGVEQYFRQVRRFKEELMVLVHMAAGAPARATELISIQHENGPQAQSQRGVFIDNGMVVFVTNYHKGYKKGRRVKIVHRYVPREIGEIVVYYLWLVEPFVRSLQVITHNQFECSPWLWQPRPQETWSQRERDHDSEDEIEDCAEPANAASGDEGDEWSDEEGEVWLGGMAPQSAEAQSPNVDGLWDTDRVRRVMYRETESRIGVRIGVATRRHAYPAIQSELSHDPGVQDLLGDIYERPGRSAASANVAAARAQQAGHSIETEEMIYGLLLTANPFATMSEQARFRRVSVDWHRMLRFPLSWTEHAISPEVQHRLCKA